METSLTLHHNQFEVQCSNSGVRDPEPVSLWLLYLGAAGSIASILSLVPIAARYLSSMEISESDRSLTSIDLRRLETNCDQLSTCIDELEMLLRTSEGEDIGFSEAVARFGSYKPRFNPEQFNRFQSLFVRATNISTDSNRIIYELLGRAAEGRIPMPKDLAERMGYIYGDLNKTKSHEGNLWEGMSLLRKNLLELRSAISVMREALGA